MTFSRLFGTFALVLAAASLAAAQQPPSPPAPDSAPQAALSPYTAPQVPPSAYHAPQPPPTTYPSPWQAYPYYGVPQPTWALSVSGGKLLIESADGSKAVCEALTIPVEGAAAVELTVEGKHIHVRSVTGECGKGKCCPQSPKYSLVGSALRVSRNGPKGCVLTLEGEATLSLVRKGKKAELTAERISVDLVTDRVEGYIGHPPHPAPYVTPVGPQAVSVPIDTGANAAADPLVEPVAACPCTSTSPSPAASPLRRPR